MKRAGRYRMKRGMKRALAALALASGMAAPAAAGPVAELGCLEETLSAEQSTALVEGVGKGRRAAKQDVRAGAAAVMACARRFEWTPGEVQAASHYIPAFAAQRRFRSEMAGHSVDLAWIEREIAADERLVAAAAELRGSPPELSAFLARIEPSLAAWQARHGGDPAAVTALGGFVAATALLEGMRLRFSR